MSMFFRDIKLVSTRTSNVCYTVNKRIWKSRFFSKLEKNSRNDPKTLILVQSEMHGIVAAFQSQSRVSRLLKLHPQQNSSSRSVTQLLQSALRCHNTHETQLSTGFQRSQTRAFCDLISVIIKTILTIGN